MHSSRFSVQLLLGQSIIEQMAKSIYITTIIILNSDIVLCIFKALYKYESLLKVCDDPYFTNEETGAKPVEVVICPILAASFH